MSRTTSGLAPDAGPGTPGAALTKVVPQYAHATAPGLAPAPQFSHFALFMVDDDTAIAGAARWPQMGHHRGP